MKDDERRLLVAMRRVGDVAPYGRNVVAALGIHPNRAAYLFSKWADKGWYDYGVSVMAGWLEPAGEEAARAAKAQS